MPIFFTLYLYTLRSSATVRPVQNGTYLTPPKTGAQSAENRKGAAHLSDVPSDTSRQRSPDTPVKAFPLDTLPFTAP